MMDNVQDRYEVKVDEKLFKLFLNWYRDNVGEIYSMTVMVADRINYFNEEDILIGYIYLYMEETYYIRQSFYNLLTNVDGN